MVKPQPTHNGNLFQIRNLLRLAFGSSDIHVQQGCTKHPSLATFRGTTKRACMIVRLAWQAVRNTPASPHLETLLSEPV
eukprot:9577320-Alexandrium_andersonii.AAC.1